MEKNAFQLLKPLRVIQLGPERKAPLEELPSGAEIRILRESSVGGCMDIAYEDERYFALKNELFCEAEDRASPLLGAGRREEQSDSEMRQHNDS